jgi:hypothetical protein
MRRGFNAIVGFAGGLVLTWACAFLLSQMASSAAGKVQGCGDIEHCGASWWWAAGRMAFYLGPAVLFSVVAYVGTGREWRNARWAKVWCGLIAVTVLMMAFAYR